MSKLALHGGPRAITEPAPDWPERGTAEEAAVAAVVTSGKWWMYDYDSDELAGSSGQAAISRVEAFEQAFAAAHRARYALAVNSGSSALEVCMRALELEPGAEVITTPYTFFATSSCIFNAGAWPVYVDIDRATYNIDPSRIEEAITERTRAIMPVHFGGEVAAMDAINAIAEKHGLAVIEDAAQAQGVSLEGDRYAGTLSLAGTISFQASKCLSCGEGGLILTDDDEFADRCWSLRHCGRSRAGLWYEHFRLGWNLRMPELSAALLLAQLDRLADQNRRRMDAVAHFLRQLAPLSGLVPTRPHPKAKVRNHYLVMLRYDASQWDGVPRDRFVEALVAEGLPVMTGYAFPNFENPAFQNIKGPIDYRSFAERCPNSMHACREEAVWLMHSPFLGGRKFVDAMAAAVFKVRDNLAELRSGG